MYFTHDIDIFVNRGYDPGCLFRELHLSVVKEPSAVHEFEIMVEIVDKEDDASSTTCVSFSDGHEILTILKVLLNAGMTFNSCDIVLPGGLHLEYTSISKSWCLTMPDNSMSANIGVDGVGVERLFTALDMALRTLDLVSPV